MVDQKVTDTRYIEPGVIAKDKLILSVQKLAPGKPQTGEQAMDKKAVQYQGAWLARLH